MIVRHLVPKVCAASVRVDNRSSAQGDNRESSHFIMELLAPQNSLIPKFVVWALPLRCVPVQAVRRASGSPTRHSGLRVRAALEEAT